jgi:hypothetical protein
MQFNADMANFDVNAILQAAKADKAKVELTLRSGTQFTGKVAEVGTHAVVLAELSGREFYDAMIFTQEIAAITTLVRKK